MWLIIFLLTVIVSVLLAGRQERLAKIREEKKWEKILGTEYKRVPLDDYGDYEIVKVA